MVLLNYFVREKTNMEMQKFKWSSIKEGMVIQVKFVDGNIKTGVVHTCGSIGFGGPVIQCNQEKGQKFTLFSALTGVESIVILKDHPPVAQFGMYKEWDFVSNHHKKGVQD